MGSVEVPLSLWLLLLLAGLKTSFAAEKKPVITWIEDCTEKPGDVVFKDLRKKDSYGTLEVKKPITEETNWDVEIYVDGDRWYGTAVEVEGDKDPFFEAIGLPSQPPIKKGEYKFSDFKTDLPVEPLCTDGKDDLKVTIKESFAEDVSGEACIKLEVTCK